MPKANIWFNNTVNTTYLYDGEELEFPYPCLISSNCTPYHIQLPQGTYKFELYGASGGFSEGKAATTKRDDSKNCNSQDIVQIFRGNTQCNPMNSPGAGGYITGFITLQKTTLLYLHIGGKGEYKTSQSSGSQSELPQNRPQGGYNGGGDATGYTGGSSGGGGSTDIRVLNDDYWHRIIVAGGGGGTDDYTSSQSNDGSGGAGGYPAGQNCFITGKEQHSGGGTQEQGYSFFQGESATYLSSGDSDFPGSGGGWFGGHFCSSTDSGGSGGSSFILTKNATIPNIELPVLDKNGEVIQSQQYAFTNNSPYLFSQIAFADGIWSGDGYARITVISTLLSKCITRVCTNQRYYISCLTILISEQ